MIAVDTNILVYAHRKDSEWHKKAVSKIKELAESQDAWGIPLPCLHEFYSIVTHPKIFSPPSSSEQAIKQMDEWLRSPSIVTPSEGKQYWPILRGLLSEGKIAGPLVHDARVAAICIESGFSELWTADRDFSRFSIRVKNPLIY